MKSVTVLLVLLLIGLLSVAALKKSIYDHGYQNGLMECAERQIELLHEKNMLRDALTEEKVNEIRSINDRHRAQLDGLRLRASRPGVPTAATPECPREGSSGAELSREDAQFLAGEAANAAILSAALKACQKQNLEN